MVPEAPQEESQASQRRVSRHKRCGMLITGLFVLLAGCGGSSSDSDRPQTQNPQNPPVQEPPPPAQDPPVKEEPVEALATDVGTPLEAAVTQTIGSAGGVIESADGTVRVEVPAGALATEQTLSIQPIANHAHGKVGGAFRLGPEGVTFASPVRLTFYFEPEQIAGTSQKLLRVASQNRDGFWELHEDLSVDADERSVTVETHHFSDWSLVSGAQLAPQSATVKPGESVQLSVEVCERVQTDDLLAPLVAQCRASEVYRALVKNWSVNGTAGGDGNVGTIEVQENGSAVYTAPATAPQPNTVAVSAEYTTLQGELVILIADIRVQSGLCTPPNLAEPCRFDLFEFNGEALPYSGLPREPWENLETVTSGRLSLWDSDGDGAGTWSLRIVWIEAKQSGDLEQFEQLAGEFTSETGGKMNFTVLNGPPFTGSIQQDTVAIVAYPASTKNVSAPARLKLRLQ